MSEGHETFGDRRFDGERWWTWDGHAWLLVPDWDQPSSDAEPDRASGSDMPTSAVVAAPAPTRRNATLWGMVGVVVALAVVIPLVVWLTRTPAPDYRNPEVLAARLQTQGNDAGAKSGAKATIVSMTCTPQGSELTYTCTASLSDATGFTVTAKVAADGSSFTTS